MNDQRKDEIGTKFLLGPQVPAEEFKELELQELIFLIHSAKYFKEQEALVRDDLDDKLEVFLSVLIDKIKDSEALYIAYDQNTGYPYIDPEDRAWLFSKEEYAFNAKDYFMQQLLMLEIKKISREEINRTLAEFHTLGLQKILIDNGQYHVDVDRDDILPPPDWSGTPEINIPVTNPGLQHALMRFFQTLHSGQNDEGKNQLLQFLEGQMLDEVIHARYLLPMQLKQKDPAEPNEQGVMTVGEGTTIEFGVLGAEGGTKWLPAFTDWNEFEKVYDKTMWSSNIASFDDLLSISENMSGIVINCRGIPLQIDENNKKRIEQYRSEDGQSDHSSVKQVTLEKDTEVLLGAPKEYPEQMLEAVKAYMKKQKGIRKAYLRLMVMGQEQSYLLIVDFEGNREEVFGGIAEAANSHLNGMLLNMVELDDWAHHVKDVEPFYKKKRFGLL